MITAYDNVFNQRAPRHVPPWRAGALDAAGADAAARRKTAAPGLAGIPAVRRGFADSDEAAHGASGRAKPRRHCAPRRRSSSAISDRLRHSATSSAVRPAPSRASTSAPSASSSATTSILPRPAAQCSAEPPRASRALADAPLARKGVDDRRMPFLDRLDQVAIEVETAGVPTPDRREDETRPAVAGQNLLQHRRIDLGERVDDRRADPILERDGLGRLRPVKAEDGAAVGRPRVIAPRAGHSASPPPSRFGTAIRFLSTPAPASVLTSRRSILDNSRSGFWRPRRARIPAAARFPRRAFRAPWCPTRR